MVALSAEALVCAVRAHGEHGSIIRALTRDSGLVAGYVRGGRSRRMRPILIPGNLVAVEFRARTEEQLAGATVELLASRAPLLTEPLAAAAIDWATSLTAATLPESQPYPQLFDALSGLLDAIGLAPTARGWAAALARYELLLLGEIGFGLDLDVCTVTGTSDDIAYVSPKTGGAVSRGAAVGYEGRLFVLPPFLRGDGSTATLSGSLEALRITGHFLDRALADRRPQDLGAVRQRLIDRLQRAVA